MMSLDSSVYNSDPVSMKKNPIVIMNLTCFFIIKFFWYIKVIRKNLMWLIDEYSNVFLNVDSWKKSKCKLCIDMVFPPYEYEYAAANYFLGQKKIHNTDIWMVFPPYEYVYAAAK